MVDTLALGNWVALNDLVLNLALYDLQGSTFLKEKHPLLLGFVVKFCNVVA